MSKVHAIPLNKALKPKLFIASCALLICIPLGPNPQVNPIKVHFLTVKFHRTFHVLFVRHWTMEIFQFMCYDLGFTVLAT